MGRSRYAGNRVIDGHLGTWRDRIAEDTLGPDALDGLQTIAHVVSAGDRLDSLARKYYGDPEHWWVIAIANRIMFPLSLDVGRKLHIPADPLALIAKLQR